MKFLLAVVLGIASWSFGFHAVMAQVGPPTADVNVANTPDVKVVNSTNEPLPVSVVTPAADSTIPFNAFDANGFRVSAFCDLSGTQTCQDVDVGEVIPVGSKIHGITAQISPRFDSTPTLCRAIYYLSLTFDNGTTYTRPRQIAKLSGVASFDTVMFPTPIEVILDDPVNTQVVHVVEMFARDGGCITNAHLIVELP